MGWCLADHMRADLVTKAFEMGRVFAIAGEGYLDKYGIQDAVKDRATVPVYYQGRLTEWHLEGAELDILFDQWFVNEPDEKIAEIKKRGVTKGDLARFQPRIAKVALDVWTHYRAHVLPDGFKAQVVAIDRKACVVYKKELDRVIAHTFQTLDKMSAEDAKAKAAEMSVCIYSKGQHDQQKYPELVKYQLDEQQETKAIEDFKKRDHPLKILIVCNKLLTGFDAPVEQAMYLDTPLSDHNLLQAIARTNRRCGQAKTRGTIVDYIGVSKNLADALSAYNDDDVEGAMTDEDALHAELETAHREVMELLGDASRTGNPKADAEAAVFELQAEDCWYEFLGKANVFLVAYGALSPDPRVLTYKADLKYIGSIIPYGKMHFEMSKADEDWRGYSEKIREMLLQHLQVTGLATVVKLRSLADPAFWDDFKSEAKDLQTAAVRKLTELKKETTERAAKNPARYKKFSEHVQKLINKFQQGLLGASEVLEEIKATSNDVIAEDNAFTQSGLSELAYDVFKILEVFKVPNADASEGTAKGSDTKGSLEENAGEDSDAKGTPMHEAAARIDELYRTHEDASAYWQDKGQSRKNLLQLVRRIVHPLGISDWDKLRISIDEFTINHYAKP